MLALANNTSGKSKSVLLLQGKEDTQGTLKALYCVPAQDKTVSFFVDFLTSATVCCQKTCRAEHLQLHTALLQDSDSVRVIFWHSKRFASQMCNV